MMTHKQKKALARRHMTPKEVKMHMDPFMTSWWRTRAASRQNRALKIEAKQQANKERRKKREVSTQ